MIRKVISRVLNLIILMLKISTNIFLKDCFPAGRPASIDQSKIIMSLLKQFSFFDSGFFVYSKLLKNISVHKFPDINFYLFLNYKNDTISFVYRSNLRFSKSNRNFLKSLGIKKIYNYLAPEYKLKISQIKNSSN